MSLSLPIRFPHAPQSEFFHTLRHRVNSYFNDHNISRNGNWSLYHKAIILYTLYIGGFVWLLSGMLPGWAMIVLCVIMGFAACGLGTNVMHDALHNAYTPNKRLNTFIGYTMEMLGGSSLTWRLQHNILHHTYTNVYGMDEDIHDKPFLRLSPDGVKRWYHRYQHLYAGILYGLSNVSWLIQKDFKQFVVYWKNGLLKQEVRHPWLALLQMTLTKGLFFFTVLVLPVLITDLTWYQVMFGFLIVQFVSSFLMTTIFLTAHAVESAHHFQPDEQGNMENNWAIHQIMTTCNFKTRNWFWHWFVGGLNHQIEHHLFPGISHVHYDKLSVIVKQTSIEYGLPYYEYESFGAAMRSHFAYLKTIGNQE